MSRRIEAKLEKKSPRKENTKKRREKYERIAVLGEQSVWSRIEYKFQMDRERGEKFMKEIAHKKIHQK